MKTEPQTTTATAESPQQQPALFTVSYWSAPENKLMYRRISPTEMILLQVHGRDLGGAFSHRHEKVTYPSSERLEASLSTLQKSDAAAWEDLMNEYLQVNKVKLEMMNVYRQSQYDRGLR